MTTLTREETMAQLLMSMCALNGTDPRLALRAYNVRLARARAAAAATARERRHWECKAVEWAEA